MMGSAFLTASNVTLALFSLFVVIAYSRWLAVLWLNRDSHRPRILWVTVMAALFAVNGIEAVWWTLARLAEVDVLDRVIGASIDFDLFRNRWWFIGLLNVFKIGCAIVAVHAYCRIAHQRTGAREMTLVAIATIIANILFLTTR